MEALRNMEDTTAGVIYLDTAEYLIMAKDTKAFVEELREVLKPKTQLCFVEGSIEVKEAGGFLSAHGRLPQLKDWKEGEDLPVIATFKERLTFLKKVEKSA